MSFRVLRQALGQSGRSLSLLGLGAAAFFYVTIWSSASFISDTFAQSPFFSNPPRAIRALLGSADFLHPRGWVAVALGHPLALSLFAAGALIIASGAVATEVERGTIEFVLSRPIRRRQFLLSKLAGALISITVVEALAMGGTFLARQTVEKASALMPNEIVLAFLGSWLTFAAFAMVATFVSSMTSLRGRALGIAVGLIVVSFFLNVVALLVEPLYWIRYASLFNYVRVDELMAGRSLTSLLVPAGVSFIGAAAALGGFARKDITR